MNKFSKSSLLISALSCAGASFALAGCVSGEKAGGEEKASVGQVQQAALSSHSTYAQSFVNAGYRCKVNDEFGGVSGQGQAKTYVDSSKWTFQNLYVNNELQNYTNKQCVDMPTGNWNYCVENGLLTIQARNESLNCAGNASCATYFNGSAGSKPYTSGRMMSQHKVARKNGYIEFRARLPFQGVAKQSGAWPAIWFLGDMLAEGPAPSYTCQWPTITDGCWPWQPELDLMEWQSPNGKMASNAIFIGSDNNMDACNDWPEGGGGDCRDEYDGWNRTGNKAAWKVNDWSSQGSAAVDGNAGSGYQGWHTYGLEWTDSYMKPWVDGVLQGKVDLGYGGSEFKQPMFVIMNLALGGDLGGVVQISDWSKIKLEVDYMRWYQMGGTDDCTDPAGGNPPPPPPSARSIANNLEAESNDLASDVQFETTTDSGGGQNAGWINGNSYIEWLVNVPTAGTYTVTSRSATTAASTYAIRVDGTQVATNSIANTGGWQTWQSFTTSSFTMSAGNHRVRIAFTSAGQNLNFIKVNSASANYGLGSTIQASSRTGNGSTGLENCTDTGGGQNVMDVGNNEWISFNNVNFTGVNSFQARVASAGLAGTIEFRRDSTTGQLVATCSAPVTGGWQTWQTVTCNATPTTGTATLFTVFKGTGAGSQQPNVNWYKLLGGTSCTPTTCAAQGKNCGSIADGCGGTLTCGSCGSGQSCSNNVCIANCTPTTCAAQGKNCGSISDGCGGNLTCGACGGGQVCNNNVCAASCTPTTCAALGKNCGSVGNGCGGTLSCGSCTAPQTCGGAGTANMCGGGASSCTPTISAYNLGKCDATAVYNGKMYKCISQAAGVNGSTQCGTAGVYCSNITPTDAAWGTTAWQFLQNCP